MRYLFATVRKEERENDSVILEQIAAEHFTRPVVHAE